MRLAIGSNAASHWWLNGSSVIAIYGDRQSVIDDGVSRRLTLRKGRNVIRAAIVNGGGATDFCARFLDAEDRPITGLSVSLQVQPGMIRRLLSMPLFWPLAALALLLLGNGLINPGFLALQVRDGHLYGNLVDIANRAAPLALVSMGMTLVIAVRGLDISVGAVLAIAATVAAWTVTHLTSAGEEGLLPLFAAIGAALAQPRSAVCGMACWWSRRECSPLSPR